MRQRHSERERHGEKRKKRREEKRKKRNTERKNMDVATKRKTEKKIV